MHSILHDPLLTPENRLWRAVLEQAYADAESSGDSGDESESDCSDVVDGPPERIRARCYLRGDNKQDAASLVMVCGFAEVPADRVLNWARRNYPRPKRNRGRARPKCALAAGVVGARHSRVRVFRERCPHDWSYAVTRRKSSSTSAIGANGHAADHSGANGHAAALESVATSNTAESDALAAHLHRAGSDDSTADLAAGSASSAGARAGRDAYAELAQADPAESANAEGKWLRPPEAASQAASNARRSEPRKRHEWIFRNEHQRSVAPQRKQRRQ